jgi:hypothetical protein
MADSLNAVAIGVYKEGSVVSAAILWAQTGLAIVFASRFNSSLMKRANRVRGIRAKADVRSVWRDGGRCAKDEGEVVPTCQLIGRRPPVRLSSFDAQRGECCVVELLSPINIRHRQGNVIKHFYLLKLHNDIFDVPTQ